MHRYSSKHKAGIIMCSDCFQNCLSNCNASESHPSLLFTLWAVNFTFLHTHIQDDALRDRRYHYLWSLEVPNCLLFFLTYLFSWSWAFCQLRMSVLSMIYSYSVSGSDNFSLSGSCLESLTHICQPVTKLHYTGLSAQTTRHTTRSTPYHSLLPKETDSFKQLNQRSFCFLLWSISNGTKHHWKSSSKILTIIQISFQNRLNTFWKG